jgi:hypothetical protein
MYSGGSMLLGQGIADGEMFQAVIGATGPIVAFIWWFFWERNRVSK